MGISQAAADTRVQRSRSERSGQFVTHAQAHPRVLMLSPRSYERALFRCGQVECEDVIRAVDDVELIAPRAVARGEGFVARKARRLTSKLAGVELSFQPRIEKVRLQRDYELFVFYARSLDDLQLLATIPGWRKRCARAVCILEEVWSGCLAEAGVPEQLHDFDLLTVQFHGSVEPLRAATSVPVLWLPAGVDAVRFHPGLTPPTRSIDVFGMGRRSEDTHRMLVDHAARSGWTYLFDTIDPRAVRDGVREHRVQLAELVKRSRFFVVNKAKIDFAAQTGAQEEVGFRSFEGAAGGAIMIGHTPRGPSVDALFDWPDAHIHVPAGSAEIADVMRELDRDVVRAERIRRDNVSNSLLRHDWAYRWQAILCELDILPRAALTDRVRRLHRMATAGARDGAHTRVE